MSETEIICIYCNEKFVNMFQYGGHKGRCDNRKRAIEFDYNEEFIRDYEDIY